MDQKSREKYLRVTHMLYPFSGLQAIDSDLVMHAAERGTRVHKTCEGIIKGLGEIGVDEETWGYVESFKKWWSLGHELIMMEERFYCDDIQVTGQIDLMIKNPTGVTVVDLKTTSKPHKTWDVQAAGYAYLARKYGHDVNKIIFVHLNKHGKEPTLYEYQPDDSFFFAVLRVYRHFFLKEHESA